MRDILTDVVVIVSVIDVFFMVFICFYYGFFKNRVLFPVISIFLSPFILDRIVVLIIPKNIQAEFMYKGGAFVCIFTLFIISKIFHTKYSLKEYLVLFFMDIPISIILVIVYFLGYRIIMNLPL